MPLTDRRPPLDARAKQVLRALVQRYLQDGNPVGSRTLAHNATLTLSPATIRNVMADLEELGFLTSPHTSAGRIPSARGIRLFIDQFLTVTPLTQDAMHHLQAGLQRETLQEAQSAAARVISQLTKYAGFVAIPAPQAPLIRKLRFVKLSSSRILAVIVTADGNVQNRVFAYDGNIAERALAAAAAAYNRYFADMTFGEAQSLLAGQMLELRGEITTLLATLLERVGAGGGGGGVLHIAGEFNLLKDEDLSGDMRRLRDLYDLLERKKELMRLLERGESADNVHVFIGSEAGVTALEECSVVFSSCGSEGDGGSGAAGKPLGVIGVLGPKRMRYNQVIPTVDIAAKLLRGVLEDLRLPRS